ncbi:MAG: universal stress protein [Dehalococcoidales bacterium]|jgi:nucleotide-binding universal stress UspA family protein|nr:universal stress protein [Dehalococcoidales bacterium]
MYKSMLIPLDGSALSETSLAHVLNMTECNNPPAVVLLRAREPMDSGVRQRLSNDLARQLDEAYQEEMKEYLEKVAAFLKEKGITAKTVAATGPAAESILDYSRENDIDIIVMSSHGRTGIARWAFGSVTEKVLKESAIPVLVIPHKAK